MSVDPRLLNLIKETLVPVKSKTYQYYNAVDPVGTYLLGDSRDLYTKFWFNYCHLANDNLNASDNEDDESGDENNSPDKYVLSLCEAPNVEAPILSNITLTFKLDPNSNIDNINIDRFKLAVINAYQTVISRCLMIKEGSYDHVCCLLTPDHDERTKNTLTYRFHLIFPFCKIKSEYNKNLIIPNVISTLRDMNAFKYLMIQPSNDWTDIIDPLVSDKPYPLYRSISAISQSPFHLQRIYGKVEEADLVSIKSRSILSSNRSNDNSESDNEESSNYDDDDKYNIVPLSQLFNPTIHQYVSNKHLIDEQIFNIINPETNEAYPLEFWLPLFLSLHYWNDSTPVKEEYRVQLNHTNSNVKYEVSDIKADQTEPHQLADIMLTMIDKKRGDETHYWLTIGKAIYNSYHGSSKGLDKFINYTLENSVTHTEDMCREKWPYFRTTNFYTHRDLAYIARQDNPEKYKEWHIKWCIPFMEAALDATHFDVAQALYHFYWLEYVCPLPSKRKFHQYKNGRWNCYVDGESSLRVNLSTEFAKQIELMRAVFVNKSLICENASEKSNLEKSIERITKLIKNIKTTNFKNNVIREAADLFYAGNENFNKNIDSNPNLMALQNGVIELTDTYATFRPGLPGDMVGLSSHTPYDTKLHWEHPMVRRFMYWMKQCFYYDDLIDYFLRFIAMTLRSGNLEKVIGVFVGSKGNNSKSMLKKFLELAFGDYLINFSLEVITGKKTSSAGPSPELARANKRKLGVFQEPGEDDYIRNGALKALTGGDSYFARMNNENGEDIVSTFTALLFGNIIPGMENEKALRNRLRIIPMESLWSDYPNNLEDPKIPETPEEQMKQRIFKLDSTFGTKLPMLAPAGLWVLVQYFEQYVKRGLEQPPSVVEATARYWSQTDIYKLFITENIEFAYQPGTGIKDMNGLDIPGVLDLNQGIKSSKMYEAFREWYRNNYNGKSPERAAVIRKLVENMGPQTLDYWRGFTFRMEDEGTAFNKGGIFARGA